MFTNFSKWFESLVQKVAVFFLLFSFTFSPLAPVVNVYAQEGDAPTESTESDSDEAINDEQPVAEESNSDEITPEPELEVTEPEPTEETQPVETESAPAPEEEAQEEQKLDDEPEIIAPVIDELIATSTATTTEELVPTGEKFKKNNSLSVEEQLAAVRQHLMREGLPQVAIDRLGAFEEIQASGAKEQKGISDRVIDFFTSDREEVQEKENLEHLIKQKPFQVETFNGKINTAPASRYEKEFSEAREQGNIFQKVSNVFRSGTIYNSNFDKTKNEGGFLARLFKPSKVMADVDDDPSSYLADGEEITFSQAIQDQADALDNDPLKMLNFVRNEVEYVPYYGSKKGADATLTELMGNDMDQASLLIAMLRYSDIPARYRHVDAKMDTDTVNRLFGVSSSTIAAEIMSLQKIPYQMYTLNGEPYFFVVEHTYVEAYMPYGVSRGTDINDGGESQWVPMDPSIATYGHMQPIDIMEEMRGDGFDIETFFDNYLAGDYENLEPLDAFKSDVEEYVATTTFSQLEFPEITYEDAVMTSHQQEENLEIIPGTLPFEISADLNTYDFIPDSLRHTIEFTVDNEGSTEVLNYTAYVSDLADNEVLVTYEAATEDDQEIIDGFETIYDVVPLTLVAVKPVLKVKGVTVAEGTATSTLGQKHEYTMDFIIPSREMGEPVDSFLTKTIDKDIVAGNTDAIAINTDYVLPPELRPAEDTETDSYFADQVLYRLAVDYLDRLQYTHEELVDILGGQFTHSATRVAIFNGIEVTNSSGQPYSFDWKGLRIDAYSQVRYYHNFDEERFHNREEFIGIFGLQASQDESDIFEDNFDVESVATVKGLKMVANDEFAGVTLEKITEANEGDIDTLSISTATKNVFHDAVGEGKVIYTPSEAMQYGEWEGLFYIVVDFEGGDATYAIGEGLNGGYSVCSVPEPTARVATMCVWSGDVIEILLPKAYAAGSGYNASFSGASTITLGSVGIVNLLIMKSAQIVFSKAISIFGKKTGPITVTAGNGTGQSTTVNVVPPPNPLDIRKDFMFPACDEGKTGNCTKSTRKASDIKQIVIHYTAGRNATDAKDTFWNFTKPVNERASAHYIIERDGTIYQLVPDLDLSWHSGKRSLSPSVDYMQSNKTIGIEVVNWGWLTENEGDYKTYREGSYAVSSSRQVYDNGTAYSPNPARAAYRYWEDYPDRQVAALDALLDELTDKYAVNKVLYSPNMIDYEESAGALANFNGILGHSVIGVHKWDPGPAMAEYLENLVD